MREKMTSQISFNLLQLEQDKILQNRKRLEDVLTATLVA